MSEMKAFVVVKPYKAEAPEELNLQIGDIVTNAKHVEGEWMKGQLSHDKCGIFLLYFCRELTVYTPTLRANQICLYSYDKKAAYELSLKQGEVVTRLGLTNAGWSLGMLGNGQIGDYPSNYAVDCKPGDTNPKTRIITWDHTPSKDNELGLKTGDRVKIVDDIEDDQWVKGERSDGAVGFIPANITLRVAKPPKRPKKPKLVRQSQAEDDEINHLRAMLSRMKSVEQERKECSICFTQNTLRAFSPCGHKACVECIPRLRTCHICRETIEHTIPCYD